MAIVRRTWWRKIICIFFHSRFQMSESIRKCFWLQVWHPWIFPMVYNCMYIWYIDMWNVLWNFSFLRDLTAEKWSFKNLGLQNWERILAFSCTNSPWVGFQSSFWPQNELLTMSHYPPNLGSNWCPPFWKASSHIDVIQYCHVPTLMLCHCFHIKDWVPNNGLSYVATHNLCYVKWK